MRLGRLGLRGSGSWCCEARCWWSGENRGNACGARLHVKFLAGAAWGQRLVLLAAVMSVCICELCMLAAYVVWRCTRYSLVSVWRHWTRVMPQPECSVFLWHWSVVA